MRCEDAVTEIGSSLAGELEPEAEARLHDHLAGCEACRAEYDRLREVWDELRSLPPMTPDSAAMQRQFLSMLDSFQTGADQARVQMLGSVRRPESWPRWAWAGAMAASLIVGVLVGRGFTSTPAPASTANDLALLRQELHDTRELVTLSLLRQSSATDRLRGVSWTGRIDDPGVEVVSALLDALSHDPNVNVRLAAVDALARFSDRPAVRSGAVAALGDTGSPLVQIALIDLLVQLREPASREAMKKLADDERVDTAVRDRAAWGLQQLG
jgi:putative zinc finger protein/HEAT repeat protein